jgi:hypothetical protein
MPLDATAKIVDRVITGNDSRTGGRVTAIKCFHGNANRVADERAQTHHV